MNTVSQGADKRDPDDYGPGVRAALAEHRIEPDRRIHDVADAYREALAEYLWREMSTGDSAEWIPFDEGEYEADGREESERIIAAIRTDGATVDPAEMTGPAYSVDHVGLPSPDAHAIAHTDRWLIWSNQHGMWWRDSGVGYTSQIDEAGRYSRAEAAKHVADATLDGALTHRRTDPITGREYSAVDEVAVLAPESIPAVTA